MSIFNQLSLYWILLDVPLTAPIFFSVSHPTVMKPCMPYGKCLRLFKAHPVRRSALDHLYRLLNCYCLPRRQQDMQMIRHQHKRVQLVKSPVPATQNLLDNNIRQERVDE